MICAGYRLLKRNPNFPDFPVEDLTKNWLNKITKVKLYNGKYKDWTLAFRQTYAKTGDYIEVDDISKVREVLSSENKKELVRAIKLSTKPFVGNKLEDSEESKIEETYNNVELNRRIREATEAAANIPFTNRTAGTSAAASMTSTPAAMAASRILSGQELRGYEIGHLCDENQMDYSIQKNWQAGFAIAHVVDGYPHMQLIQITRDYTCVVDGKVFRA
jgi:hypothetical protein